MRTVADPDNPFRNHERGSYGYPVANDIPALVHGARFKRKSFIVHFPTTATDVADMDCVVCGRKISDKYELNPGEGEWRTDDLYYSGTYYPRQKALSMSHYYCGWGALMQRVVDLAEYL